MNQSRSTAEARPPEATPASATQPEPLLNAIERDIAVVPLPIQCELTVGSPDNPLEDEADAMADHVMRKPESDFIQRKCVACGDEKQVQRKAISPFIQKASSISGAQVGNETATRISSARSGGAPLPEEAKSFMESRFGNDFGQVRIHDGAEAAMLSRDLGAQAFTVGNDVFFGGGKFAPDTDAGNRLLAHELTHTIQQSGPAVQRNLIQRDLAVEPTVAEPTRHALDARGVSSAILFNQQFFRDASEIAEIREALGAGREPAVIDEDFVRMLADYQADFGLTQDGKLGPSSARRLAAELGAESDLLEESPTGTPRRRAARRLLLRSQVATIAGGIAHQGFIGPDDNPDGIFTVRTHGNFGGSLTDAISHNYTGRNANNIRFLQFVRAHMSAIQPGATTPVFNSGSFSACAAGSSVTQAWSPATAPVWGIDSCSATDPFYDAIFSSDRVPGVSFTVADQPQDGLVFARNFASTLTPPPTTVTLDLIFDTYAVSNATTPLYHNRWMTRITYDITGNIITSNVTTNQGGGTISRLNSAHKTALDAHYSANTIR